MNKTSNELLYDILGVLGQINQQLSEDEGKKSSKNKNDGGGGGVLSTVMGVIVGKSGIAKSFASDIDALNKSMNDDFIKRLTVTVDKLKEYNKVSQEAAMHKKNQDSPFTEAAKDISESLLFISGGILAFVGVMAISAKILDTTPSGVLGFVIGSMFALAISMLIIAGMDALSSKFLGVGGKGKGGGKGGGGGIMSMITSTIMPDKTRNKTSIDNARHMGIALMYIAGGVLSFVLVFKMAAAIFGSATPMQAAFGVMGIILVLGVTMKVISMMTATSKDNKGVGDTIISSKTVLDNAKRMGIALMYIAGGVLAFSLVLKHAAGIFNEKSPMGVAISVLGIIVVLGTALWLISLIVGDGGGGKGKGGKFAGASKGSFDGAKQIGTTLLLIAGSIFLFSLTLSMVPVLLGEKNIWHAMKTMGLVVLSLVGLMFVLKLVSKSLVAGIVVAKGIGTALILLSFGVLLVAFVSKQLLNMFSDTKGKDTDKPPGPFAILGNALTSLGLFGLFVAGTGALLWVLGIPTVGGVIAIGSLALMGMAISLILTTIAIRRIYNIMEDIGGTQGMLAMGNNIRVMVSSVIGGVVSGIMDKDEMSSLKDSDIKIKDIRQMRRVSRVIRLLGSVSTSLSRFARGLRAFAKLGEIASLDYEMKVDESGQESMVAAIGKDGVIHVTEIAKTIGETFRIFINGLLEDAEKIDRDSVRHVRRMNRIFNSRNGILSSLITFSDIIKVWAQFGANSEVYIPEEKNAKGEIIRHASNTPVLTIVTNIIDAIGQFVTGMDSHTGEFEVSGSFGGKMNRLTVALLGDPTLRRAGFLGLGRVTDQSKSRGILAGLIAFHETLLLYSNFGTNGMPVLDAEGNIKPGKYIKIETIVDNIIRGITTFTTSMSTKLEDSTIVANGRIIETKISSLTKIVDSLNRLALVKGDMQTLSDATGALAENIGKLSTNLTGLDVNKLNTVGTTVQTRTGAQVAQRGAQTQSVGSGGVSGGTIETPDRATNQTVTINNNQLATAIANAIVASLTNRPIRITFHSIPSNQTAEAVFGFS